jgi:hypothetical protein
VLRAPTKRRDRILLYGPAGGGKSTAWLDVAEWSFKTRANIRMPVLDTDKAWDDMAPYDGHLDKIVEPFPCPDWDSIRSSIRKVEGGDYGADDVLVVDMAHRIWDRAQEGFFEKVFGRDIDEFFTLAQGDRQKAISGDYGTNWQAINKLYGAFTNLVMNKFPGHVIVCTSAQRIWEANEKDKVLTTYPDFAKLGYKPQGQKDLPHQFRTILFLQDSPSGWRWSTAKERNPPSMQEGDEGYRGYYAGEQMKSFTKNYLMKVAGWKL